MLRKNIRLRREYIYHQSTAKKTEKKYEDKLKIKNAMIKNTKIPTELQKESEKLKHELQLDDSNTLIPYSHIDDEYRSFTTPKLLMTTSHSPSIRLIYFMKEMSHIIPNSTRLNRGNTQLKELIQLGNRNNFSDVVIFHEHRGVPDGLIISHLPIGPTLFLGVQNAVLRHDLKKITPDPISEQAPHLVFHGIKSQLGERIKMILQKLFPVPKSDTNKIITFANQEDVISFRHHIYDKQDYKTVGLREIGPRFELKPYQIILGTLDQKEVAFFQIKWFFQARKEWVLRPYMNTAVKRQAL